ncbi:MAG: hypothetical protein COZ24_12830 [Hydrogenophilales bacterium CG_4_10_14_3_um_filter_63_21]|nr:MAG: hypothetical protein COZ24_12830 [Hydrogenophilales bacterium CG_4_10_14_3_um_filter_63_21]
MRCKAPVAPSSPPIYDAKFVRVWAAGNIWNRRLKIDRSGPFFTGFLPHSRAMRRQIRQKLASLGPFFAFRHQSPTSC